jgi:negative regulator of sigma E activity
VAHVVNLAFILLLPFVALQSDDLSRIITAQRQQDFSGIWVREFRHADTTLTVVRRVWHRHPDQARIEFIEPEKLLGSTLFINGETVRFVGNRHVRHFARSGRGESPTFVEALRNAAELDWIRDNYAIESSAGDILLGRPAEHLRLAPKHPHRGRLEIWPDRETGILLRTRRYDRHGNLVSASYFREIEFAVVDSASVAPPDSLGIAASNKVDVDNFTDLGVFIASAAEALLLPRELPAGFHFHRVKTIHRSGKKYFHFQYSDGLTTISFFQHPSAQNHDDHNHKSKPERKRGDDALTLVRGEQAGIAYSLLGEVAQEELQAMAASMVLVKKEKAVGLKMQWLWLMMAAVAFGVILWWWSSRRQRPAKLHR